MAEVCPDAEETGRYMYLQDHHREKRETEVRGVVLVGIEWSS